MREKSETPSGPKGLERKKIILALFKNGMPPCGTPPSEGEGEGRGRRRERGGKGGVANYGCNMHGNPFFHKVYHAQPERIVLTGQHCRSERSLQ